VVGPRTREEPDNGSRRDLSDDVNAEDYIQETKRMTEAAYVELCANTIVSVAVRRSILVGGGAALVAPKMFFKDSGKNLQIFVLSSKFSDDLF